MWMGVTSRPEPIREHRIEKISRPQLQPEAAYEITNRKTSCELRSLIVQNAYSNEADRSAPWDKEVDVLVVGSGVAGMTAALVAAKEGADTLLCEKTDLIGGTSAISGGTIWIPGNRQANDAGIPDSCEDGLRYLQREVPYASADELQRAYIYTGQVAVDYLERHSEVKFYAVPKHPDYLTHPGAALGGRPLAPIPFDGRTLGADFALLRPAIKEWTIFGGMMVAREDIPHLMNALKRPRSFWHTIKLLSRYASDRLRYSRGTRLVLGNALMARMLFSLRRTNCVIAIKSWPTELIRDHDGGVLGAVVNMDGAPRRIRARKGVVLAAGGFPHSREWRDRLMAPAFASQPSSGLAANTGDSLDLATAVGGTIEREHHAPGFLIPISIMKAADGTQSMWLHSWDRSKPGQIAVNRAGRRFTNEARSYHDFSLAMHKAHETEPTIPAYLICDHQHLRKFGFGLVRPGGWKLTRYIESGYLMTADTIIDLARQVSVDPEGLRQTVLAYSDAAKRGIDPDFGKGETPLDRINGDPAHGPNPCMGPIEKPPFYAIEIRPGDIGTSIGLKTNVDAQVLDNQGRPIQGLYACGNDMSSVMRGHYPGPGITLGPGLVFGYRAALHATRSNVAPLSVRGF
jgi:succinate dehydrogenase/fumarate reductase flavoprotein subunit